MVEAICWGVVGVCLAALWGLVVGALCYAAEEAELRRHALELRRQAEER